MLNTVSIMGRLTKDPEIRRTADGKAVASFSIACQQDYNRENTDFFNCVAFSGTAEFIEKYFFKGAMIAITGRLQTRSWEKDGAKKTATEIIANNVYFCERKNKETSEQKYGEDLPVLDDEDDKLPF